MKTNKIIIKGVLIAAAIILLPFYSSAKKPGNWLKQLNNNIGYNDQNREILRSSIVFLEVAIDEEGKIIIEKLNTNKPEAGEYIIKKLATLRLQENVRNERFVLKYYFK